MIAIGVSSAKASGQVDRGETSDSLPRHTMPSSLNYWTLRFVGGLVVLLASGAGWPAAALTSMLGDGRFFLFDGLCGIGGFWLAFTAIGPMVRGIGVDARLRRSWGKGEHAAFARASVEQHVFLLLLGVAEVDGKAGLRERELVRTFLLQRFPSPKIRVELERWSATAIPPADLGTLAQHLAFRFESSERSTLYSWCRLVAFADGDLHEAEQKALRAIASGLGLEPRYAQFLFGFAQQASMRNRTGQGTSNGSTRSSAGARPQPRPPAPPPPSTPRERALRTLGLPSDADQEQIRQRHRELVRKFHPDAHQRLGEVAMQEAAERFKAIQRAYEELCG